MKKIITVASYFIRVDADPQPPAPHPEDNLRKKPSEGETYPPYTTQSTAAQKKKMRGYSSTSVPYFNSSLIVMQSTRKPNNSREGRKQKKEKKEKREPKHREQRDFEFEEPRRGSYKPHKEPKNGTRGPKRTTAGAPNKKQASRGKRDDARKEFDKNRKKQIEKHRAKIEKELKYKKKRMVRKRIKIISKESKKNR